MEMVSYPMFELSTMVDILQKAYKAGKTINKQLLANASTLKGNGSIKSGVFNQKLSALKHYNLITLQGSAITFTPLAEAIIQNQEKSHENAFLAPKTFMEMFATLEKNIEIETSLLLDIARHKIGVSEAGKSLFVKNFVRSGVYAGLIEYSLRSKDEIIVLEQTKSQRLTTAPNETETPPQPNTQKAELKTSKGRAVIIVPEDLSDEDKIRLKAQIELF